MIYQLTSCVGPISTCPGYAHLTKLLQAIGRSRSRLESFGGIVKSIAGALFDKLGENKLLQRFRKNLKR